MPHKISVPRKHQHHEGQLYAYEVVTPHYATRGDGYYDPPEWGCDYRLVYTRTAKRAIMLAVRAWRRATALQRTGMLYKRTKYTSGLLSQFVIDNIGDQVPPWKGVKAVRSATEEWIEAQYEEME